jgi:hypothetical protein
MLTIFTIPKAFRGHIGVIQRNAIESWTHLRPRPEIILLGDDEGTAEVARELGLLHLPTIARSDHGTPLLNDMFRQAEQAASFPSMCYVNADIILSSDFLRALELVRRKYPRSLVISKRITFDVSEHLNFDEHWEPSIKERARASGRDDHYTCIDVFAFSKGMYPHIPDFAIGRLWFDHWLIKAIRLQNLPVVDVSLVAPVLHQNHDYNHVAGGFKQVWQGQEAARNFELYGGVKHAYTLLDVTHKLTSDGSVRRVLFRKPLFTLKQFAWENFVHRTGRLRKVVGLRRKLKEPAANQSS